MTEEDSVSSSSSSSSSKRSLSPSHSNPSNALKKTFVDFGLEYLPLLLTQALLVICQTFLLIFSPTALPTALRRQK
jgi:hypothetical protein